MNAILKQMERTEKQIGEYRFFIKPFPAFTAARLSGDLAALVAPLLSGLAPLIGSVVDDVADAKVNGNDAKKKAVASVMDLDIEEALPSITEAFSSLSGEKFEKLMGQLLVDNENISVAGPATDGHTIVLDRELANEVFCGEIQDMFILCFDVIRLNFKGFFKKFGTLFGSRNETTQKNVPNKKTMED